MSEVLDDLETDDIRGGPEAAFDAPETDLSGEPLHETTPGALQSVTYPKSPRKIVTQTRPAER